MKPALSSREKWLRLAAGEDVGPMVSPLCDNWALDIPYRWPVAGQPEPFPEGHAYHAVAEQIAMAEICGWDPSFLAGVSCDPRNESARPTTHTEPIPGGTRTESRVETPYGPLTTVSEHLVSNRVVKHELETAEDYRRKGWFYRQQLDHHEDVAIAQGRELRAAIGDRGVLGTWMGPPIMSCDRDNLYYHLLDWPDACETLRAAALELTLKRLDVLRSAGFDYVFYCVDGTEWTSPGFFEDYVRDDTQVIFDRWRNLGGFVLWHSCGHVRTFVERGFYNEFLPEVFETLSEPPVGDLPSLAWAREQLDPRIATKGNLPLNILLQETPEAVRAGVERIMAQTRGTRHVVGLSDDVLAGTPLANARALVEAALQAG
jgi:hypothetical protein